MTIDFYVYLHKDESGNVFYVGKGLGNRAWSKDRHPIWHRYVSDHLGARYTVGIFRGDLSESDAESLEAKLTAQFGE